MARVPGSLWAYTPWQSEQEASRDPSAREDPWAPSLPGGGGHRSLSLHGGGGGAGGGARGRGGGGGRRGRGGGGGRGAGGPGGGGGGHLSRSSQSSPPHWSRNSSVFMPPMRSKSDL